ncbi:hypothetical protein BH10BDE1_BH10BDE1_03720 [soil metagenome]
MLLLSSSATASAATELRWFGDLRLRGVLESRENVEDHLKEQLRARVGVEATVDPEVKGVIRLVTAKSHRSGNQGLGDASDPGGARRFIGIDVAYAEWTPMGLVKFDIGRIPQNQIKVGGSQIILDDDLALEGFSVSAEPALNDSLNLIANAGSDWIRENYDSYYSTKNADNTINWAQLALRAKLRERESLLVGTGFHAFTSLKGMTFNELSVGGASFGNTEKPAGKVKNEYLAREFFAEWRAPLGSMISTVALQHVLNTSTGDPNRAWWLSLNVAEPRVWDIQVSFELVESDAVPGVFTDSDFANGFVDAAGFIISSRWFFGRGLQLRLTQYLNKVERSTNDIQYLRTHLDLSASF